MTAQILATLDSKVAQCSCKNYRLQNIQKYAAYIAPRFTNTNAYERLSVCKTDRHTNQLNIYLKCLTMVAAVGNASPHNVIQLIKGVTKMLR